MPLKAALASIPGRLVNVAAVPAVPRTVEAADLVVDPGTTVVVRRPDDIDEIALRLISTLRSGGVPERRDMNQAAWCIWEGKRPLADMPLVLGRLLDAVRATRRRSAFHRLAAAYLSKFEPVETSGRAGAIRDVADALRAIAPNFAGTYSNAGRDLSLFDPDRAPGVIAGLALAGGLSPTGVMERAGIRNLAAEGGLAEAAFLAGLKQLASDRTPSPDERLARVSAWGLRRDGSLLFGRHRGPLADALVLPLGDVVPAKDVLDQYLRFLVSKFGDPRLKPAQWAPMQCTDTVRRWLTALSLRQFLDVVDHGAMVHQWQYRRAFWEAVHRRDLISDAWVVFDEHGDHAARRLFRVDAPYARFAAGGRKQVERGHAVLLLRVGGGVIAEWSQNGRCNIWHSVADPTAPRLNQPRYDTDEVRVRGRGPAEFRRAEITHAGSEGYHWQAKVSAEIHALTNVRILESEYRLT